MYTLYVIIFERCKLWIAACNREDLIGKDPIILHKSYRICKDHFANTMFLNLEKTWLQPHAVLLSTLDNNDKYIYTYK